MESTKVHCAYCDKILLRWPSSIGKRKLAFCSTDHYHEHCVKQYDKNRPNCSWCNKKLTYKHQKHCNHACQNETAYTTYINKWKAGEVTGMKGKTSISAYIRRYLFEKYNSMCTRCNWKEINPFTGKVPLTVEHIDGDYRNNREGNLDLICPNCHSLTSTYKSLNKGKGRPR